MTTMTSTNTRPCKALRPAQTPIYRAVERLLLWLVPVVERLPKSTPYQAMGARLINDVQSSLDCIVRSAQTSDATARSESLAELTLRMTAVKTAMRVMSQLRIGGSGAFAVSARQMSQFLSLVVPVATQCASWRRAAAASANHV